MGRVGLVGGEHVLERKPRGEAMNMKRFFWVPVFAVTVVLGCVGGFAVAGAFEQTKPTPIIENVGIDDLPDQVPIAGPNGPVGYVSKNDIARLLELNPLNLDQIEPGVLYEQPLIGPTISGSIDVIGTRTCVVERVETGGSRQNCFEEHRNENSLYVQDSSGVFVPRK